ncbi:MAG: FGGY family carbohydrate kinase [Gallionellaceae bacterium]|nr:FGGY family carbohydrate kinase [Gallionellaceae bacterium]
MIRAIALDLGSTSIKAGLLDDEGMLGNIVSQPAPPVICNNGRCESDALAYAETADQVLAECLAQPNEKPPLGLCSQRSSFLIWERASGKPVTSFISWQDTRGAASCEELKDSENLIRKLTGLRLTPYYFAPKLRVALREHPEWRAPLERGEWLVGTLDSFLIWRWTQGAQHVSDASMAARTLLMNIRQEQWSPELCALFDIPSTILPRILPSTGMRLQLNNGLTLQASMGDQSAALIAGITGHAEALVNLGTGGFVIRYMDENQTMQDGYLQTLVYQDSRSHLAIEGTLNSLAAALAPYPVNKCRIDDLGVDDIFCLAEPSGIGAPYFRGDIGLRFSEPVEHLPPQRIAALLLEGILFRVARILEDFHRSLPLDRIYLSGGLSELRSLQQGIALCAPCAVYRLQQKETSLQGAALLAAGMAPGSSRTAERIGAVNSPLPEKYQRWQVWFNSLLKAD